MDLAIIGAGFTGVSAALSAAEQGASVAVFEAENVGYGGSGRNVGLVNAGLWLPPDKVRETMGAQSGDALISALGQGPELVYDLIARHDIQCNPVRNGTLHIAHHPRAVADLAKRAQQWQALGAPVRLLSVEESRKRTGTAGVFGALLDTRAGTIQPLDYVRGLARAAMECGAKLFEKAKVSALSQTETGWRLRVGTHEVKATRVLVATNAYHADVQTLPPPAASYVWYFQAATEPVDAEDILPGGEGCWDTATIMSSFRRDAEGRLILGGMGLPERGGGLHLGWARRKLARTFPKLRDVPFERQWSGRIAMTRDHIPKLVCNGPNLYTIFGYSGRGIAPGTVMGTAVAHAILSGDFDAVPLPVVDRYTETFTRTRSIGIEAGARLWHFAGIS